MYSTAAQYGVPRRARGPSSYECFAVVEVIKWALPSGLESGCDRAGSLPLGRGPFAPAGAGPGVEVYEGMVIGEHQRPGDLVVNVCKKRHVTNVRSSNREITERLTPPRDMSLDEAIEYLGDDELLEVTPKSLRIRKRILDARVRGREDKRTKEAMGV